MKNKVRLATLLSMWPLLLSALILPDINSLSEYGYFDNFYFTPLPQYGVAEKTYPVRFYVKTSCRVQFTVGLENELFPDETTIGNSTNWTIEAAKPQIYDFSFTLKRQILTDEKNTLRLTAVAYPLDQLKVLARKTYYYTFSLAKPAIWELDFRPLLNHGATFSRSKDMTGCTGFLDNSQQAFRPVSYSMYYYGFEAAYTNPRFDRIPLQDWTFRFLNANRSDTDPMYESCYLRLEQGEADFAPYGEEKWENGQAYRIIPLSLIPKPSQEGLMFGGLTLQEEMAISRDGRIVRKKENALANDLRTWQIYLPPLKLKDSALNYVFDLYVTGCGEYHIDTIHGRIPISKTHNFFGNCLNSDWCVGEL
jgi:hypothetical protein